MKRLGEIRGDSVLLCISSTSITFSFSKSFHRAVAAIVLQTWCISIPTTLTAVWDSHTASPSPLSRRENEHLVWLQEEAKCVQLGYPRANCVQGYATYSKTSMGCLGTCLCSDRPKCIYIRLHKHVSVLPSFQKRPQQPDQTLAQPLSVCRVSNE